MRETNGSAWMANRRRGCGDDLRRFDTQPGEQVASVAYLFSRLRVEPA